VVLLVMLMPQVLQRIERVVVMAVGIRDDGV